MRSEQPATEERAGPQPSDLLGIRPTIALATAVCLVVLAVAVGLAGFGNSLDDYTTDPAGTLGRSPFIGMVSYVGVLLSFGAGVICLFAGALVARVRGVRYTAPLLLLGAGVSYLALDDLFLLHENVYPRSGIREELILVAYAAAALTFFWRFRGFLREQEWPLLVLALFFLTSSFALDVEDDTLGSRERLAGGALEGYWVEDVPKLFGIAFLSAYLVRVSARMLIREYPVVPADAGPQSSADPPTAVTTPSPR